MKQEQWEIDLREKLDKELEDCPYEIEADGMIIVTGKSGYINFKVGLQKQFDNPPVKVDSPITKTIVDDFIQTIFKLPKSVPTIYSSNQKRGSNKIKPKKRRK